MLSPCFTYTVAVFRFYFFQNSPCSRAGHVVSFAFSLSPASLYVYWGTGGWWECYYTSGISRLPASIPQLTDNFKIIETLKLNANANSFPVPKSYRDLSETGPTTDQTNWEMYFLWLFVGWQEPTRPYNRACFLWKGDFNNSMFFFRKKNYLKDSFLVNT